MDKGAWQATVHGVTRVGHELVTKPLPFFLFYRTCVSCIRWQILYCWALGKIPWWRKWKPTPVFLPGKPHGTEEPGGLQQMGCKELDMTAQPSRSLLKALYCMLGIQRWTRGTDSLPSKTLQSTSVMSTTKEEHRPLQDCRGCERHNLSQETRAGLSLLCSTSSCHQ